MNENYYFAVFNENTWDEFLKNGSSVYGTTLRKKSRMEKINPGDFLICYISKISCFAGLLEITSKAYIDEHPIWKNDIYPVRVNVYPVYILEASNGVPFSKLREELAIYQNLKHKNKWAMLFYGSLNKIQEKDAKIIIDKLKEAFKESSA